MPLIGKRVKDIKINNDAQRILIVDSQQIFFHKIKNSFTSTGYRLDSATHPEEAIDLLNKQPYHLIISAVKFKKSSCVEFRESILKNKDLAPIPFVVLTAQPTMKDRLLKRVRDINGILDRSSPPIDLITQVSTIIENHEYHSVSVPADREAEKTQKLPGKLIASLLKNRAALKNEKNAESILENEQKDVVKETNIQTSTEADVSVRMDGKERRQLMAKIDQLVESISSISGITRLVIASRDGTVLAKQGVKGDQISSLTSFIAISAEHIKETMGFTTFHFAQMNQTNGEKMLVLTGNKIIVGLGISASTSVPNTVNSLKPIIDRITI